MYGGSLATKIAISKLELAFTGGDRRLSAEGLSELKQTVGVGLIRAHYNTLQIDIQNSIGRPGIFSVQQIDNYHYEYFGSIGLPRSTYGGRGVPGIFYCSGCDSN